MKTLRSPSISTLSSWAGQIADFSLSVLKVLRPVRLLVDLELPGCASPRPETGVVSKVKSVMEAMTDNARASEAVNGVGSNEQRRR